MEGLQGRLHEEVGTELGIERWKGTGRAFQVERSQTQRQRGVEQGPSVGSEKSCLDGANGTGWGMWTTRLKRFTET